MAPTTPSENVYKPTEKVERLMHDFELSPDAYKKVSAILLDEMNKGLQKATHDKAPIKMFPTYVQNLPNGTESGSILALDLGGTNFRVLLIELDGHKAPQMKNKVYPIPEKIMLGTGAQLFDLIASCIADFLGIHGKKEENLSLGFTFSFPLRQKGLNKGILATWTKGFKCEGVEGNDVVQLLHEALERRGDLNVHCVAILNDTVGCLMSCAFCRHDCEVGVILGTGTNACYMEHLDAVELWEGEEDEPRQTLINTEWGAFGDNGVLDFILTDADRAVDKNSLNPGKQLYEKMISGMYMGEIARLALLKAAKDGLLFKGVVSEELNTAMRFYTKYISEIEEDSGVGSMRNTRQVIEEIGYHGDDVSEEDCRNVHYICHVVGKRAAYLAATGIATLLNRINKEHITVAVDGSLYRYHPLFHKFMVHEVTNLLNPGLKFTMMLSEDGSGKGAALVAAVSARVNAEKAAAH